MRFLVSVSLALLLCASGYSHFLAQTTPIAGKPRRFNELTLAGLRPGRDTAGLAIQLYKKPSTDDVSGGGQQLVWAATCTKQTLWVETDINRRIQVVKTADAGWEPGDCRKLSPGVWHTGRGLRINDSSPRVVQLYGEPDSRSPSTKDGQQLELLYYAFDWAGAAVPQVMEVLCTVAKDGKPGRVVEITLAAPSL